MPVLLVRKLRSFVKKSVLESDVVGIKSPEYLDLIDKNRSYAYRSFWSVIVFVCFATSCYQTVDRLLHYFEYPLAVDIHVDEMSEIQLPGMKICTAENEYLLNIFGDKNTDVMTCAAPLLQVWDIKDVNYTKLWDFETNATHIIRLEFLKNLISDNINSCKVYTEKSFAGHCTVVIPRTYVGREMYDIARFHFRTGKLCSPSGQLTAFKDKIDFYGAMPMLSGYDFVVKVGFRQYEFLATPKSTCVNDTTFDECYTNCLVERTRLSTKCRLPFFNPAIKHQPCTSSDPNTARESYLNATIITLIPKVYDECKCVRTCNHQAYVLMPTISFINPNDSTMTLSGDRISVKFTERLAYDKISFMMDIGGSLGLFMGLSILLILDISYQLILWLKTKFHVKLVGKKSSRIQLLVQKQLTISKLLLQSKQKEYMYMRVLWVVIFLLSMSIASLMIHRRVVYYVTFPKRTIVEVEMKSRVTFPPITVCGVNPKIANFKKQFAKKHNLTNWCDIDLLDLYKFHKRYTFEFLWAAALLKSIPNVLQGLKKVTTLSGVAANETEIATHVGNCVHYTFWETEHAGLFTLFPVMYFPFQDAVFQCTQNYFQVFLGNLYGIGYNMFDAIHSPIFSTVLNDIRMVTFKRLLHRTHPCVSKDKHDYCHNECLRVQLEKSNTCKLPFSPFNSSYTCNTTESAKISRLKFLKTVAVSKDTCNCDQACEENIFYVNSYTLPQPANSIYGFAFTMVSNIVENIIEVEDYPMVALLCDVGNIIGLALGMSILTLVRFTIQRFFVLWLRMFTSNKTC